jgi:hypothetical protein
LHVVEPIDHCAIPTRHQVSVEVDRDLDRRVPELLFQVRKTLAVLNQQKREGVPRRCRSLIGASAWRAARTCPHIGAVGSSGSSGCRARGPGIGLRGAMRASWGLNLLGARARSWATSWITEQRPRLGNHAPHPPSASAEGRSWDVQLAIDFDTSASRTSSNFLQAIVASMFMRVNY